jgi:hypothetical protein
MTVISALATTEARVPEAVLTRVGGVLARYGLVVVIGWIGLLKFTRMRRRASNRSSPTARS